MKNLIASVIVAFSLILAGAFVGTTHKVEAQSATPSIGLTFAASLSTCQALGQNTLCIFGSSTAPSAAVSIGGGPFVDLGGSPAATGVVSFNTRTGAVVPANGDYSFSNLSGSLAATQLPAQLKCNLLFTLSTPATATTTNQLSGTAQLGGCQ